MRDPVARLREALVSGRDGGARVTDWRLFWTWWMRANAGVKDSMPAGPVSPVRLSEGLTASFLIRWSDGLLSGGSASGVSLEDPRTVLANARASAYDDPDGAVFAGPSEAPDVPLLDGATVSVARGEIEPIGRLMETAAALADRHGLPRVSGSVSASHRESGVTTSAGCDLRGESSSFSYWFGFEGRHGDGQSRREPVPPEAAAPRLEEACRLAVRLGRDEDAFASGTMPVLLHPDVAEGILETYLVSNLSGSRVWNGQSAFRKEQFGSGEAVLREDFSARLEPLEPLAPGSYRFTREGVTARRFRYVEDGRLAAPILDLKYARRFGRDPVPPPRSIESIVFSCGRDMPFDEALQSMDRGLYVLGILGLHTQDPTSGEMSLGAPQSLAVRTGSPGGRVRAGLSANVFGALRHPSFALVRFPGFSSPGLLMTARVNAS